MSEIDYKTRYEKITNDCRQLILANRNTDPNLEQAANTTRVAALLSIETRLVKWGVVQPA